MSRKWSELRKSNCKGSMDMFTGKTKNVGVIGYPIEHSLSPVLQNAAIAKAGIDYAYIAMPVKPEVLEEAVRGMKALGFRGINVTIPHKTEIMQYLDEIDKDAKIIGAVNTVVNTDGYLKGYNTDVIGSIDALYNHGVEIKGKNVVLFGAGGAARAIIWGLLKAGAAQVTLGVRNVPKVKPIAEYFSKYLKEGQNLNLFNWNDEGLEECLRSADILINTTPLGMAPKVDAAPPVKWDAVKSGAFAYDIIYTPAKTRFLEEAEQHGCEILNGEEMLAGQGAAAFKLWTDTEPELSVMTEALRKALE